jgi:hypothetical protein
MEQKKLWFKAKRFGWGWTPVSWQGWGILVIFVIGLISEGATFGTLVDSGTVAPWGFLLRVAVLVTLFITICYAKGEQPHWRWGK